MKKYLLLLLSCYSAYANPLITAGVATGTVTFNTATNFTIDGNISPTTVEFTVSGNNTFLLVAVSAASGFVSSIAYNGVGLDSITEQENPNLSANILQWYGMVNPSAGTHNLVITHEGTPGGYCVSMSLWTDVNQSTPYSNLAENNGNNAASPSSLTVSATAGRKIVSAISLYDSDSPLASAPQTIICSTNGFTAALGVAYTNASGASISCPYTYTSSRYWYEAGIMLNP